MMGLSIEESLGHGLAAHNGRAQTTCLRPTLAWGEESSFDSHFLAFWDCNSCTTLTCIFGIHIGFTTVNDTIRVSIFSKMIMLS